jgi:hypothetical protein
MSRCRQLWIKISASSIFSKVLRTLETMFLLLITSRLLLSRRQLGQAPAGPVLSTRVGLFIPNGDTSLVSVVLPDGNQPPFRMDPAAISASGYAEVR